VRGAYVINKLFFVISISYLLLILLYSLVLKYLIIVRDMTDELGERLDLFVEEIKQIVKSNLALKNMAKSQIGR